MGHFYIKEECIKHCNLGKLENLNKSVQTINEAFTFFKAWFHMYEIQNC